MNLFPPVVVRTAILALAFVTWSPSTGRSQGIGYEILRNLSSPGLIGPRRALTVQNDGTVFGTAQLGGSSNGGGIFKVTSSGAYSEPVSFAGAGATPSGLLPDSELTPDGAGYLWGTTFGGGTAYAGTIFRFDPALGTAVTMAELNGSTTGVTRGTSPFYGLTYNGAGSFFGTVRGGGASNFGALFSVTTAGVLTTRVDFTGTSGAVPGGTPECLLTPDGQGRYFGTCYDRSTGNKGTIFRYDPSNDSVVRLVDFGAFAGAAHGANPLAGVTAGTDGFFYGCTRFGGASNLGVVYKMAADGTITNLVDLTGTSGPALGSEPVAPLLADGADAFLGVASKGGASNQGLIFRVKTDGTYTVVFEFSGTGGLFPGAQPLGGLVRGPDGRFYGSTYVGGATGEGTVFRFGFQAGPTLATNPATAITTTTATLNATVNPGGSATTVNFFLNGGAVGSVSVGAGAGETQISQAVSSLSVNTTYTVTTTATNAQGNANGGAVLFTTLGTASVANPDDYELPVASKDPRTNDADSLGLGLSVVSVGPAAHGASSIPSTNRVRYIPNATFTGTDSFSYTIADGNNTQSTSTITVHDTTPPVIVSVPGPQVVSAAPLLDYTSQVTATDNSLVKTITQSPAAGFSLPAGQTIVTFTVTDAAGLQTTGQTTVTRAVSGAVDDSYELPLVSKDPRLNDADPLGAGLTLLSVGAAAHGTASIPIANRVSYVPANTFSGTDSFSYTIADGNNAQSTAVITVRDTTPPVITAHPPDTTLVADGAGHVTLVDYLGQVTASDNSFVKSITQSPPAGTVIGLGTTTVTFTATDAAGLTKTAQTLVSVQGGLSIAKVTGDPVASVPGATWTAFRSPAIDDRGDLVFAASFAGAGIRKGNDSGIFIAPAIGAPVADTMVAREGEIAPDSSGATFAKFSDPVANAAGHVAFTAKLKGAPSGAVLGVFSSDAVGLHGRAFAGGTVVGSTGKVAGVLALAMNDADQLALLVTLAPKRIVAITFSDGVGAAIVKVAQVGEMLTTTAGAKTVETLAFLPKVKGVYPQTRGLNANGAVAFRATFTDGTDGIFLASISGSVVTLTNAALTGGAVPAAPAGGVWGRFGQPMLRAGDESVAFSSTLAPPNAAGLFGDTSSEPLDRLLAVGDPAPGVIGATFAKFSDVLSPAPGVHAFIGTMLAGVGGVSGKNAGGLWAQTAASPLALVARTGIAPPGVAGTQKLKKFRAVAQPADGRVVFAGQLKLGVGVTAKSDVGIWAVNDAGALELIVREGGSLIVGGASRKVIALEFLPAVPVVGACSRGFNSDGQLTFRATLKGRVQALFRVNR